MSGSGVHMSREIPGRAAHRLEKIGASSRPIFYNQPTSVHQERRRDVMMQNKVMIRKRMLPNGKQVFDVYTVCGFTVKMYASNLPFEEEALECAKGAYAGRIVVSVGGVRRLMLAKQNGLVEPLQTVGRLADRHFKTSSPSPDVLIVERAPKEPSPAKSSLITTEG